MKIIPTSDILIEGKHSPAGAVASTSDIIGKALIAQGLAKAAPAETSTPAAESADTAADGKETAEAKPEAENASAVKGRKTRTSAPAA